jgi:hypothetical protein
MWLMWPSEINTDKAVEEEVVVVSHRGVVENRRHFRTTGVLDQQISRLQIRINGVFRNIVSLCALWLL